MQRTTSPYCVNLLDIARVDRRQIDLNAFPRVFRSQFGAARMIDDMGLPSGGLRCDRVVSSADFDDALITVGCAQKASDTVQIWISRGAQTPQRGTAVPHHDFGLDALNAILPQIGEDAIHRNLHTVTVSVPIAARPLLDDPGVEWRSVAH